MIQPEIENHIRKDAFANWLGTTIVVTKQNSGQSIAKSQATVYRKRASFI